MRVQPEWFLVGLVEDRIIASVMAGYDGHRGWINYLAVDPDFRRAGHARATIIGRSSPSDNKSDAE